MKKNIFVVLFLALILMLTACVDLGTSKEKEYTDYKESEKESITAILGEVVPFFPNSNYTMVFKSNGFSMTIKNATKEQCEAYIVTLKSNGYTDSDYDATSEDANLLFVVEKGDIVVAVAHKIFDFEDEKIECVFVQAILVDRNVDTGNPDTQLPPETDPQPGTEPNPSTPVTPTGTFTAEEQALFEGYFGLVVPYLEASEYYVEDYYDEYGVVYYYTIGNTETDFANYKTLLVTNGYAFTEEYVDDYGDTCYVYVKDGIAVDVCAYTYEGDYIIDVYVYFYEETDDGGDNPSTPVTPTGSFTAEEQALFKEYFGLVIPYLEASEYYVDDYYDEYSVVNYYTIGNTEADYANYKTLLVTNGYVFTEEYVDDYGDTCFVYVKDGVAVDMCAYLTEDSEYVIDIYVYFYEETGDGDGGSGTSSSIADLLEEASSLGSNQSLEGDRTVTGVVVEISEAYTSQYKNISFTLSDGVAEIYVHRGYGDCAATLKVGDTVTVTGEVINYNGTLIEFKYPDLTTETSGGNTGDNNGGSTGSYTYNSFTDEEKELFETYIGTEIPFLPNNEYYVEGYYDETGYEYGMSFYTFGNTEADFNSYVDKLESWGYALYESYEDDYGDTWYTYYNDDVVIDLSFYYYEGDYVFDLYIYSSLSKDYEEGGNNGGESSSDADLITNDGKGLPNGENGLRCSTEYLLFGRR